MPCYYPLKAYRAKTVNENGKRPIVFNKKDGFTDLPVTLPCGQCIGCKLERSRQWAIRCHHEASMYQENCFITLTYNDDHLPDDLSLNVREFQLFMKRLRKEYGAGIRYFHCGEYGEQFARPHYHACIFNHDFEDKKLWTTQNGEKLYTSQSLSQLWPYGFSTTGTVTFQSAAYVARYITKKITGDLAVTHYEYTNPITGEITHRKPEYTTMSRRPGIGKDWLNKYTSDIYPGDFVVMNGKKMKPPKYYDKQYEIEYPSDYAKLRSKRLQGSRKNQHDNTPERLKVRLAVQEARLKRLPRNLD